ncbi:MAG: glycosyltransferase [Caldilineaceae bacterium]
MTKFKILILIKSLGLGGAERLLVDSLPYLKRDQYEYHFAYLLPWKDYLTTHLCAAGFAVHCLGRGSDPAQPHARYTPPKPLQALTLLPAALYRLNCLQRQEQFDLIHADLPVSSILARLLGQYFHLPVVYTEHNLQERYHPWTRQANRLTYRWNSHVVAVSGEVMASIARHGLAHRTQVTMLLNGVPVEQVRAEAQNLDELRAQLNLHANLRIVGTVAVFRSQKRLTDWVAMAAQVAAQRDDVIFLLVGDGPEMPTVRAQVAALGIADKICLVGFREDGRRLLGLMDIYVMSSEHEGLPIALLEAMALGKPVVATSVGGIPEVLTHGEEGYCTDVGDIDHLAGHVIELLDRPALRQQMGQRGAAKIAAHYHIKQRVRAIETLYRELLTEGKP